jgi:hypothetical protein
MFEFLSVDGLNWIAIGLSLVWAILQGYVWYSFLWKRQWNVANGRAPDAPFVPPGPIAALTFVMAAVYVFTAALVAKASLPLATGPAWLNGLVLGVTLAVGLVWPPLSGYTIWERRSLAWFGVTGGEAIVKLAGIGLILGMLP